MTLPNPLLIAVFQVRIESCGAEKFTVDPTTAERSRAIHGLSSLAERFRSNLEAHNAASGNIPLTVQPQPWFRKL